MPVSANCCGRPNVYGVILEFHDIVACCAHRVDGVTDFSYTLSTIDGLLGNSYQLPMFMPQGKFQSLFGTGNPTIGFLTTGLIRISGEWQKWSTDAFCTGTKQGTSFSNIAISSVATVGGPSETFGNSSAIFTPGPSNNSFDLDGNFLNFDTSIIDDQTADNIWAVCGSNPSTNPGFFSSLGAEGFVSLRFIFAEVIITNLLELIRSPGDVSTQRTNRYYTLNVSPDDQTIEINFNVSARNQSDEWIASKFNYAPFGYNQFVTFAQFQGDANDNFPWVTWTSPARGNGSSQLILHFDEYITLDLTGGPPGVRVHGATRQCNIIINDVSVLITQVS